LKKIPRICNKIQEFFTIYYEFLNVGKLQISFLQLRYVLLPSLE